MTTPFHLRADMLGALVVTCLALAACGGGSPAADDADGAEQALGLRIRQLDRSAPTLTVTTQSAIDSAGTVSIQGSASDNIGVKFVKWSNQTGGGGTATLSGSGSTVTWSAAQVQLQAGDNTLTFVALDTAGNRGSTTTVVTYTAPIPAPPPDTSLSSLPVKLDLLANTGPTASCAEGYKPGPEVNGPAIPVTDPALTHSPSEVATWRARTMSGPFVTLGDYAPNSPGDWTRIKNSAKAFLASGEATVRQLADDPARSTHGTKARDAAFVYLITSDTSYLTPVRDYLIAQTANPANDFTKLCIRNLDGSVRDAWFRESSWLVRQIVTYDYVRSALSLADRQTIENWIRRNAYFFATQIDRGMSSIFPKRLQGDYATRTGAAAAATDSAKWSSMRLDTNADCKIDASDSPESYRLALYTRADGSRAPHISILSLFYNNRKSTNALAFGAAGALLGDTELVNRSKRYFLEWLTFSVWPDGAQGEYQRNGDYCVARQGLVYGSINTQAAVMVGDWLARRGDTSLFDFSTRDGLFGTESGSADGAKSISLAVATHLNLINGKLDWYQYEPWKTAQQPRLATSIGKWELYTNGSPRGVDDFHDLGYLIGADHMPAALNVAKMVMRDPNVTSLAFPGSTGRRVDTGFGSEAGVWDDALGALPSVFLLRP